MNQIFITRVQRAHVAAAQAAHNAKLAAQAAVLAAQAAEREYELSQVNVAACAATIMTVAQAAVVGLEPGSKEWAEAVAAAVARCDEGNGPRQNWLIHNVYEAFMAESDEEAATYPDKTGWFMDDYTERLMSRSTGWAHRYAVRWASALWSRRHPGRTPSNWNRNARRAAVTIAVLAAMQEA